MTHSQRSAFVQVLLYLCLTVTVSVCLSVWRWLQVSVSELVPLLVLVLHLELVWRRRVRLGLKLHTLGFLLEFTQLLASLQRRLQTNTPWHTHTHLNNRPHEFPVFQQICNHKKAHLCKHLFEKLNNVSNAFSLTVNCRGLSVHRIFNRVEFRRSSSANNRKNTIERFNIT